MLCFFLFKQKTAYEMRISDWSSDVCSSDLGRSSFVLKRIFFGAFAMARIYHRRSTCRPGKAKGRTRGPRGVQSPGRSEEHTSELQSLMRISYAVFCLKKKKKKTPKHR